MTWIIPAWYMGYRLSLIYAQAFLGMLVFAHPMPKKGKFFWRLLLCLIGGCVAIQSMQIWLPGLHYRIINLHSYFFVAVAVWICWNCTPRMAFLVSSNGYLAQHLAGSIKMMLRMLPELESCARYPLNITLLDLMCYGGTYTILYLLLRTSVRYLEDLDEKFQTAFALLILILSIGMSQLTKRSDASMILSLGDNLYVIGSSLLILFLQVSTARRIALKRNLDTLKEVMHQQYIQYENSKENVQLINEKYHDLKALIHSLQGNIAEETLAHLDESISDYEASVCTGNKVLDVLLSEKHMLCLKNKIAITSLVNGVDLGFVEELDLYTLFNNALCNAIDAVSKLEKEELRFVSLSVMKTGEAVLIHMENPCIGTVLFEDGLPQSQGDRRYHGFGMKSMERVAEKYGGTLSAVWRNGRFMLDIVLLDET